MRYIVHSAGMMQQNLPGVTRWSVVTQSRPILATFVHNYVE